MANRRPGVKLVVYGSFNCPYSLLASRRVDRLVASGAADVEWRAVVHDLGVAMSGEPVTGALSALFDRELEEIRGLLLGAEPFEVTRPTIQPNTRSAVTGFSVLTGVDADRLRAVLFDALWVHDLNIGDESTLGELGCPHSAPSNTMDRWRSEWLGFDHAHVPMMAGPDGTVSYGLDTLQLLVDLSIGHRAVK